jgi:DNA-binding response OmpR family regulator
VHNNLLVSPYHRGTFVSEVAVELTKTEFDLLYLLMSNLGEALSHNKIYEIVWKDEYNDSFLEAIKSVIKKLRKKLTDDENENKIIESVWGYGYKMPL